MALTDFVCVFSSSFSSYFELCIASRQTIINTKGHLASSDYGFLLVGYRPHEPPNLANRRNCWYCTVRYLLFFSFLAFDELKLSKMLISCGVTLSRACARACFGLWWLQLCNGFDFHLNKFWKLSCLQLQARCYDVIIFGFFILLSVGLKLRYRTKSQTFTTKRETMNKYITLKSRKHPKKTGF